MSGDIAEANANSHRLTSNGERQRAAELSASLTAGPAAGPVPKKLLETLQAIDNELDSLNSQVQNDEPAVSSRKLRGRIGSWAKRRLYRLLWWHIHLTRSLIAIASRSGRAELEAIQALSASAERHAEEVRQLRELILHYEQRISDVEDRVTRFESPGYGLEAIDHNTRTLAQLGTAFASLREGLNDLRANLPGELDRRQEQLATRISEISARLSDLGLFTHQTRTALSLQDRRLSVFIEEARKRLPEPFTQDQLRQIVDERADHQYDSLYLAFEDAFRGSREEIKARQSVYLPFLKENNIGSAEMPILDLGSGRGEWLELLREHGLEARGVDSNETMIDYCKTAGLQVTRDDAVSYLRSLPDACLGGVTSFHMVEHMPFDTVLALVDESLRVLKCGGMIVLETPNPSNILVAAQNFYLDPTHLKPLPSVMLRFFVEARGFCDVQVRELHPYPDSIRLPDDGKGIADRLNDYFYGSQDYAVIGRKP